MEGGRRDFIILVQGSKENILHREEENKVMGRDWEGNKIIERIYRGEYMRWHSVATGL